MSLVELDAMFAQLRVLEGPADGGQEWHREHSGRRWLSNRQEPGGYGSRVDWKRRKHLNLILAEIFVVHLYSGSAYSMEEAGRDPVVVQRSAVEEAAEVEEGSKVCNLTLALVAKHTG